jgi:hypothetical protein
MATILEPGQSVKRMLPPELMPVHLCVSRTERTALPRCGVTGSLYAHQLTATPSLVTCSRCQRVMQRLDTPALDRVEPFIERIPEAGCWVWMGSINRKGYGQLRIGSQRLVHRAMYESTWGPIPENLLVLHHCDVACCVNPAHLYVGSWADNGRDAAKRFRAAKKLTPSKVVAIRAELAAGASARGDARSHSLDKSTVQDIRDRKIWRYV